MSDFPTLFDVEPIPAPTYRRCPCCNGAGIVLDLDEPIPSAPARPTDPDTAHDAAAAHQDTDVRLFKAGTRKAQLLQVIAELGPITGQNAAKAAVGTVPVSRWIGAHRRVSDLVKAGFIADSGQRHYNDGSNVESIAWEVTGRGYEALDYLDKIGRSMP